MLVRKITVIDVVALSDKGAPLVFKKFTVFDS
jgi:hypothetical protein